MLCSLDKGRVVNVVYLDFSKVFNAVSCTLLVTILARCETDKGSVSEVENWLDRWA